MECDRSNLNNPKVWTTRQPDILGTITRYLSVQFAVRQREGRQGSRLASEKVSTRTGAPQCQGKVEVSFRIRMRARLHLPPEVQNRGHALSDGEAVRRDHSTRQEGDVLIGTIKGQ